MNAKERAVQDLKWSRNRTNDLLKGISDDKATHLPSPHCNHALWILGHLAVTDEWLLSMFTTDAKVLPEGYGKVFGYKSVVQGNAKAYPPFAEVKKHFQAIRELLLKNATAASEKSLEEPLGEKGAGFAHDGLDALHKCAWHEGWHAGQLGIVRKSLGLEPSM